MSRSKHPLLRMPSLTSRRFVSQLVPTSARHSRPSPSTGTASDAGVIRRHLDGVLNYAHYPTTNGAAEGLNATIQWIKYSPREFRDRKRFRLATHFHCGGPSLRSKVTAF